MKLIIHIGGHFETSYRLERNGNDLIYYRFCEESGIDGDPESIQPSDEQWDRFWKFMRQCDGWAERYEEPGKRVMTSWLVDAENGELRIWSSGSNDYPENFKEFWKKLGR